VSKSDKECAQTLVAAAVAARGDRDVCRLLVERNLTTAEIARGGAHIASGKTVTGK